MPQAMRTDPLCLERGQGFARLFNRALHETIDSVTRQRLIKPVKEHEVLGGASSDHKFENLLRVRPNRTPACFIAFTDQAYSGRTAPRNIADSQLGGLAGACPGVV